MKYKVLLVDDETIYLQYLSRIIDWGELHCEICGYAKDGEEALSLIREWHPDIVFMDIAMSRMNGLEACEAIKGTENETRVIIMTAYDEFSFAHQAIKLNVFDYLLKPFDKEELKEALGKCIKDIDESKKNKHLRQEMLLRDAVEAQPELLMWKKADSSPKADTSLEERPFLEGLPRKGSHYAVAILRMRKGCADCDSTRIRERLEASLGGAGIGSYCLRNDGSCITIAHVADRKEGTMERIRKAYEALLEDGKEGMTDGMPDSAALSCAEEGLGRLQEAYKQARLVFENSTKVHRKVACYEDLKSLNTDVAFYSTQDINLLIKCFELRDYPKVDDILEKMFGLSENQMFSFQYIINVYYSLMIGIHSYFRQTNENPISDYLQMQDSIITDLKDCFTVAQVKEIIKNYVYEMLSDCTYVPVGSKKEILVNKIEQYLQEHYPEGNLSVSTIAEHLFFENSYIRRVYKTQTGKTIMQRLEEIRIEKARGLLREEGIRCAEAAELTGFSDPYYFSKRFKLFCGCTPSEYQMAGSKK